ncbi:MAG: hypothetical protein ACRCUI_14530, partial [Polymorphobacter sp.]
HLDGYDQTAMLAGSGPSQRKEYYYFTENKFHGVRVGDWKFLYTTQDHWFNGVVNTLTTPVITNLALDPFERMTESRGHDEWQENRSWTLPAAAGAVAAMVESYRAFPPRQPSDEYTMGNVGEQIKDMRQPAK